MLLYYSSFNFSNSRPLHTKDNNDYDGNDDNDEDSDNNTRVLRLL